MKICLTFKTPGILDALSGDEYDAIQALARKFIEYEEYVTLEFDTVLHRVTVKEIRS